MNEIVQQLALLDVRAEHLDVSRLASDYSNFAEPGFDTELQLAIDGNRLIAKSIGQLELRDADGNNLATASAVFVLTYATGHAGFLTTELAAADADPSLLGEHLAALVAVHAHPYLRTAIADLTQRIDAVTTIGLLHFGQRNPASISVLGKNFSRSEVEPTSG